MFSCFRSQLVLGKSLRVDEEVLEEIRWVEGTGEVSLVDMAEAWPDSEVESG